MLYEKSNRTPNTVRSSDASPSPRSVKTGSLSTTPSEPRSGFSEHLHDFQPSTWVARRSTSANISRPLVLPDTNLNPELLNVEDAMPFLSSALSEAIDKAASMEPEDIIRVQGMQRQTPYAPFTPTRNTELNLTQSGRSHAGFGLDHRWTELPASSGPLTGNVHLRWLEGHVRALRAAQSLARTELDTLRQEVALERDTSTQQILRPEHENRLQSQSPFPAAPDNAAHEVRKDVTPLERLEPYEGQEREDSDRSDNSIQGGKTETPGPDRRDKNFDDHGPLNGVEAIVGDQRDSPSRASPALQTHETIMTEQKIQEESRTRQRFNSRLAVQELFAKRSHRIRQAKLLLVRERSRQEKQRQGSRNPRGP
ncbi:MAG: hypothetical protein Q9165_003721 [Trypethelium subeluteriae]